MPEPRYRQVPLEDTPYYHCISRCVRRAYLCGSDPATGFNFEHRRQWIVDRIKRLCCVFSVDLCAYAIMSNHYHIVIRINAEQVRQWSDFEAGLADACRRVPLVDSGMDFFWMVYGNKRKTTAKVVFWLVKAAGIEHLARPIKTISYRATVPKSCPNKLTVVGG